MSDIHSILAKLNSDVEELEEAPVSPATPEEADENAPTKIKLAVTFDQLVDLLLDPADQQFGRVALRKVIAGQEERLSIRERGILSDALIGLLPALAGDRTVYTRVINSLGKIK